MTHEEWIEKMYVDYLPNILYWENWLMEAISIERSYIIYFTYPHQCSDTMRKSIIERYFCIAMGK